MSHAATSPTLLLCSSTISLHAKAPSIQYPEYTPGGQWEISLVRAKRGMWDRNKQDRELRSGEDLLRWDSL